MASAVEEANASGQREHLFAVVSATSPGLALASQQSLTPSLLPVPAADPDPSGRAASGGVPLPTQQWSVLESDLGGPADPGGDIIKYFALISYETGKALGAQQQGAEQVLVLADHDAASLSCHWAALPVDNAAAAGEEQPQLLCLQWAANAELYLTALEEEVPTATESVAGGVLPRKPRLALGAWTGGAAQSWTFMPVAQGGEAAEAGEQEVEGETEKVTHYPAAIALHEDVFNSRTAFMDALAKFHTDMGTTLRIPQMAGRELDLHLLYQEVTSRGGLTQVTNERKWRDVTGPFNFPPTTTSASFVLRKYYINLLHHFEQAYFFRNSGLLVEPPEVTLFPKKKSRKSSGADAEDHQTEEASTDPLYQIGKTVVGTIHSKCEFGYFVSVPVGGQTLSGILYHPPRMSGIPPAYMLNAFGLDSGQLLHRRRKKKKRRRRLHGLMQFGASAPVVPKQNRTAYNYFFGEWRMKLKAELPDVPDREISRMIGQQWMALSAEQRLPYQALAEQDRLRYVAEMRDYHLQVERLKVAQEAAASPMIGPGGVFINAALQGVEGVGAVQAEEEGLVGDDDEEDADEDDDVEGDAGPEIYLPPDSAEAAAAEQQQQAILGMHVTGHEFGFVEDAEPMSHAPGIAFAAADAHDDGGAPSTLQGPTEGTAEGPGGGGMQGEQAAAPLTAAPPVSSGTGAADDAAMGPPSTGHEGAGENAQ